MQLVVDGNEAAARVAHLLSEVVAIYPITPASPMGELADAWSAQGRTNLWGGLPGVVEMQSEGGAAGTLHGALQTGSLATTFTASQGLLLMIPNMYKIAGELTPAVIHVAARAVATHALSIFGDHSDVMAARQTGFALLASSSVQEAQDMAAIAHTATLRSRVPFLHFFDGFRTSHEIDKIEGVTADQLRLLIDDDLVADHRRRALNPNHPVLRGTAQNPDVFFQAREAVNGFYDATPDIVQDVMDRYAELTGRAYQLFDYRGALDATDVVVLMGSGAGAAGEAVSHLESSGRKVGVLSVHLYRPFDVAAFRRALPTTVERVAVLDRTKEPGAPGEPLFLDVSAALANSGITVVGGRYGLGSKEFTPQMAIAVFDNLGAGEPKSPFTLGIVDDVTHLALKEDPDAWHEPDDVVRAVFFGLGSDGTVGANKSSAKIIGEHTDLWPQAYFVYDSKKSGSQTVSHLRFGPRPIASTHLIDEATFVACHQFSLLDRGDVLAMAAPGATLLLNSPFPAAETWHRLPGHVREEVVAKQLRVWAIDAGAVARDAGLGGRVNTVLQTCFFALAGVLPHDEAIAAIKQQVERQYGKRGAVVVRRNLDAIDATLDGLREIEIPSSFGGNGHGPPPHVPADAPDFVKRVTARLMAGEGDLLPVSALPVDGTFPTATAHYERRSIAEEIPIWDPDICIDCARCALVCPHAAIRFSVVEEGALADAPDGFFSKPASGRDADGRRVIVQVAPDDCTGCGVCVDICPAKSKEDASHKSINMTPKDEYLDRERRNFEYFLDLPHPKRPALRLDTVKGVQSVQPLFEFSGACAGCGETPYLKLMTQALGDRVVVANATGCSSIYGGNLPTTPWTVDGDGRGPAWSNSLFEDNAEFGLGMRLGVDHLATEALRLVGEMEGDLGDLAAEITSSEQADAAGIEAQRVRVAALRERLAGIDSPQARALEAVADHLVRTSVWIVGGDGWAYDIGFGGLDHVLASGRDVNILVLDTEVYSNTGGQASKATPRAAVAKFAAAGKPRGKKDLGQLAMAYGDVYVAQVAMGANMTQVVKAFAEAEAHPGVSLIIAYSPCIAHGIDMSKMMAHQKAATESGHWPLYRYDPRREAEGDPGLRLDSRKPSIRFEDFAKDEARFAMLERVNPDRAKALMDRAQRDIDDRWHVYEQMVELHRTAEYAEEESP